MKNVIQNSVFLRGLGKGPAVKTLFTISDPAEKSSQKYFDIAKLCGTSVAVEFDYLEDGTTLKAKAMVAVPEGLTETQVQDHILAALANS